jgi:hypothetical protein
MQLAHELWPEKKKKKKRIILVPNLLLLTAVALQLAHVLRLVLSKRFEYLLLI